MNLYRKSDGNQGGGYKPAPDSSFGGYLLCLFGIVFILILLVPVQRSWMLRSRGVHVVGVIETPDMVDTGQFVTVSFYVDGVRRSATLNERQRGMRQGMAIDLFYDPRDPSNVTTGRISTNRMWLLFAGAGAIALGVERIVKAKRKARKVMLDSVLSDIEDAREDET